MTNETEALPKWKLVILESPYAGDIEANTLYAQRCVRDCILGMESAQASHLLFTQPNILKDEVPEERALGIAAGLAWKPKADYSVFYVDKDWSNGMKAALTICMQESWYIGSNELPKFRIRALDGPIKLPPKEFFQTNTQRQMLAAAFDIANADREKV